MYMGREALYHIFNSSIQIHMFRITVYGTMEVHSPVIRQGRNAQHTTVNKRRDSQCSERETKKGQKGPLLSDIFFYLLLSVGNDTPFGQSLDIFSCQEA